MNRFRTLRLLADVLTVSRVFLSLCLAGLGVISGIEALPAAVLIVLVSWFTDLIDGPLARQDHDRSPTWVGQHDAEADLSTSLGVAAYLIFSGYVAPWLGGAIVATGLGLWFLHSHQVAWPVYAVPYLILGVMAFQQAPFFGWLIVAYLGATLVVRWPRLRSEYLPQFFQAVGSLLGANEHPPDAPHGKK